MTDMPGSGNNSEDLLWKASVEDHTGEFFDKFDKRLKQTDDNTNSKFAAMGGAISKLAPLIGVVGGAFGALGFAILKAVTGGVGNIGKLAKEAISLRTEIDSLNNSLETTAQIAGYSAEKLDEYEESLRSQGLTAKESLISLNQMTQSELDLEKATNLLTIAQDASIIKGVKVSQAMQDIVSGVASNNEKLLKSLGLYVNFQAEYQRAALASGRTVTQLSDAERRQIALNAVVEAGTQITGAYEVGQTSLSRILRTLPSYYEEVKYAMGGMFEPIYTAAVGEWEIFLKNLVEWLKDNEDELNTLGKDMANFVSGSGKLFLELLLELIKVIPQITGAIPNLAREISDTLGPALGTSVEEMEKAGSALQTLLKLVIMVAAGFSAARKVASETYGSLIGEEGTFLGKLTDLGKQPGLQLTETVKALMDVLNGGEMSESTMSFITEYDRVFDDLVEKYDMLGQSEKDAAAASDAFSESASEQAVAAQKLKDSLTTANYQLNELKKSLEEEELTRKIQDERDSIILAINTARQREDIERNYNERVKDILESASESRVDIAQDLADAELEIEESHRKRLQSLLEEFTFEANELARKRDAVSLLALIRRNKKQISDEQDAAEESRANARKNFDKTLQTMDESLQKQLKKADEARTKEYESLNRNLARQAELKALYDQWEEEDRQRKLDKTLKDMVANFRALDGMTQDGLNQLLNDWGTYYSTLAQLINEQNAALSGAMLGPLNTPVTPLSTKTYSSNATYREIYGHDPWYVPEGYKSIMNTGQAGQVSTLLANSLDVSRIGRVPAVAPRSSSSQSTDMHITVDGTGLDPYIQRVLVATLAEIERNRG